MGERYPIGVSERQRRPFCFQDKEESTENPVCFGHSIYSTEVQDYLSLVHSLTKFVNGQPQGWYVLFILSDDMVS
jgi:hypothetical protein